MQTYVTYPEMMAAMMASEERRRAIEATPLENFIPKDRADGKAIVTVSTDAYTCVVVHDRQAKHWRFSWTWTDTARR